MALPSSLFRPPHYAKINFGAGVIKKALPFIGGRSSRADRQCNGKAGTDEWLSVFSPRRKGAVGDWGNACFSG